MTIPLYLQVFYNAIIWNICFFMAYGKCATNRIDILDGGHSKERRYKTLLFFFILYSVLTCFGGDRFTDDDFVREGYKEASLYEFFYIESFYVFIASISKGSLFFFHVYIYIPALALLFFTLRKVRLDNYYTLASFIVLGFVSYGATRGVLAYAIFLMGVVWYYDGKKIDRIIGLALVILSYFFHSSMLLPILLFPIGFLKLQRRWVILLLILFPIIVGAISFIPSLFEDGLFGLAGQAAYKYQEYTEKMADDTSYGSIPSRIYEALNIFQFCLCMFFMLRCQMKRKLPLMINHIVTFSFALMYIALLFKSSSIPASNIFYARYFSMAPFYFYIALPTCLILLQSNRKYLKPIFLLGFIRINFFFAMQVYNYL